MVCTIRCNGVYFTSKNLVTEVLCLLPHVLIIRFHILWTFYISQSSEPMNSPPPLPLNSPEIMLWRRSPVPSIGTAIPYGKLCLFPRAPTGCLQESMEDSTMFSGYLVKLKRHLSMAHFNCPMILRKALASILKTENKTTDLWRSKGKWRKL